MKRKISAFFILSVMFFSVNSFGQNVDSISIKITKTSQPPGPWFYYIQKIDSFSNGLQITSLFRKWENNSWVNYSLNKFSYVSSVLTQKITQLWDTTQWVNSKNEIYIKSATTDSTIDQAWTGVWENKYLTITYRDNRNLDSLILVKVWSLSNWNNGSKTENTFSPDSTFLSQTISNWDFILPQWNLNNRNLWLNDSLQRDTAFIQQNYVSGLWENTYGTFYYYNSSGLVFHKLYTGWNNFTWELQNEFFNTYNSFGQLTFVHVDNFPGRFSETTYLYDTLGNLIDVASHYESMGGIVTEDNDHWYFIKYPSSTNLFLFVGNDITKCNKDSIPIGAFAFGGNYPLHYSWVPSKGLSSDTVENPTIFADSTISYTVTVTDNTGNFTSSGLNIIVYPESKFSNVQSISTSCIGCSDGQFIINFSDSDYYDIIISPNPGATILNDTIFGLPAGIYTICAGNSTKCGTCVIDTIPDDVTMVSENVKEKILFYPNPFNTSGKLIYNQYGDNTEMDVIDGFGRLIKTIKIDSAVTIISGKDLSPGTYFGILHSGNSIVARLKLVYIN